MSDAPEDVGTPPAAPLKMRSTPPEFERTNEPAASPTNAPTDVREHFAIAASRLPRAGEARQTPATNEVHDILRDNIAHADAAGLNAIKPVAKKKSRRRRDYWIALVGSNAAIATLVLLFQPNVVSVVFGASGMVFLSVGFTWVMWMLVDDY